jgi:lysophospholipase L1-like esterase
MRPDRSPEKQKRRTLRGGLAMAFVALPVALLGTAAPARASSYAALGDSYATGVGTGSYFPESGECLRGPLAYPVLAASRLGAELEFSACSGARTADLLSGQLGGLNEATGYVSVSIGGNDAGFASVIGRCALPLGLICEPAIARARRFIRRTLPGRLDTVYAVIRERAPAARVAVVGYPRAFDGTDCDPATFFSPVEEAELNRAANLLARTEREQARAFGFAFVDPRHAFGEHELCAPDPWLNGLSTPLVESFHPNAEGHRAYARLLLREFR